MRLFKRLAFILALLSLALIIYRPVHIMADTAGGDADKRSAMISREAPQEEDEELQVSQSSAASMAVLESTSGRVLFESRAYDRRAMASTTKIVTAITVIERSKDIQATVKVPKEAQGVEGSSIYLQADEEITIENLLYGLMLQSGNDCAHALAVLTGGSIGGFAAMMNETALKAGAEHSNFVNPHGLHDDEHYTTAMDLAKISAYAMKNETFRKIVGTKQRKMPWANRSYPRVVTNKNKILGMVGGGNGIKTGYTKKAGRCLVASAKRDNMEVIAVVLNCGPMFEECHRLIDKAFSCFEMTEILPAYHVAGEIPVSGSKTKSVKVFATAPRFYPLTEKESSCVTMIAELPGNLSAPVPLYKEAGRLKVYFKNQLLFTEKVYTMEEAPSLTVRDRLRDIVDNWFK